MSQSDPNFSHSNDPSSEDDIDLWELWDTLWSNKWWVAGASLLFGGGGAIYSFVETPLYQAKVVLAPVQQTQSSGASSLLAQFAPIAGIAGVSASPQVPLATLQSVQFAEDFIRQNNMLPVLVSSGEGSDKPDIRDAIRTFQTDVLTVSADMKSGLTTVTVSWEDPVLAAKWANALAKAANDTLRDRALEAAERNLAYLKAELPVTTSLTVQQSIGRLLDQEMQTVMLARGNPEYAFKVIDPAKVPKTRSSPKRMEITLTALIAGGFFGVLFVFLRQAIRRRRESALVS